MWWACETLMSAILLHHTDTLCHWLSTEANLLVITLLCCKALFLLHHG